MGGSTFILKSLITLLNVLPTSNIENIFWLSIFCLPSFDMFFILTFSSPHGRVAGIGWLLATATESVRAFLAYVGDGGTSFCERP